MSEAERTELNAILVEQRGAPVIHYYPEWNSCFCSADCAKKHTRPGVELVPVMFVELAKIWHNEKPPFVCGGCEKKIEKPTA